MEPQVDEINCKIIIVGNSGVGKTSLMNKFCNGSFTINTTTMAPNFETKRVKIFDKMVNMKIWDTAGQERFNAITKLYFRETMGVLFVYDVTCPETLINMEKWFNIVQEEAPPDLVQVLVGHKCDNEISRKISMKEGKAVADYFGMLFFEASSKADINVNSIFEVVATKIVDLHWNKFFPCSSDIIMLTNEEHNTPQNVSNCSWLVSVYEWFKF